MTRDELFSTFQRLVEMRRRVETQAPGMTGVTVTEATFGESEGILAARYGGSQPSVGRRFYCLVLGSSWTVTFFYYEAVGMPESESEARAKDVFNSVVVPR